MDTDVAEVNSGELFVRFVATISNKKVYKATSLYL